MSFQVFQPYIDTLFAPDDVTALALIDANNSGNVQHTFMLASQLRTEATYKRLVELNEQFNVYVAMNPFKPELIGQKTGRTKENVAAVKRVYADADKDGAAIVEKIMAGGDVPEPTVVLESSPGKFQFIWNVDELDRETAEPLMKAIAAKYNTDPAVTDTPRILRIPGFRNLKYADAPEVKLVRLNPNARYTRDSFHVEFKPEEKVDAAPKQERPLIPHKQIHPFLVKRAGLLREVGLTVGEIETALLRMAHAECELPLDDNKIRQVARSMGNYEQGQDRSLLLTQGTDNTPAEITPELLAREFPAYDGAEPEELPMLIQGFMPKGVGFLGSLSGIGKTWVALSIAKALTSGLPLWGVFLVKKKTAVLYLIPEASDASFKRRLANMRITQDKNLFRFRTITQGATRPLSDPLTIAMVQELGKNGRNVLVVVDTAVRFFNGGDENAAKENNLVVDSDMLRSIGADVLFLHHSPKATKDAAELTLENTLRGSGDFGAMSDFVYGFRRDEGLFSQGEGPEEVEVMCVKPRDFEPPLPFRLQFKRRARHGEETKGPTISVIDETHDLRYIGNIDVRDNQAAILGSIFKENPLISLRDLTSLLKMRAEQVKPFCRRHGWKQVATTTQGAKGLKRVFRWSNGLLLTGQTEVTDDGSTNTVAPGPTSAPSTEDTSAGF
jgi:hypothetical protein